MTFFSIGRCCISGFRYNYSTYTNRKLSRYLLRNVQPAQNQFTLAATTYSRLATDNPKNKGTNTSNGLNKNFTSFAEANVQGFNDFLSTIISDFDTFCVENNFPKCNQYMENMLVYNTKGGNKFRGMATSFIYQKLMAGKSSEVTRTSYVLGWCVEILQASFFVLDDFIDGESTRHGIPCWYKLEGRGLHAPLDRRTIENMAYFLIAKYFGNEPFFGNMISTANQVVFETALGRGWDLQTCDSVSCGEKQKIFTKERYDSIVNLKTSSNTLVLPVFLALIAAENVINVPIELAKEILFDIGHMFQAQDDFLDCFGDEGITGKFGTDIADGKCTWLAVKALELASPTQRLELINHSVRGLGIDGEESLDIVKDIYTELNLEAEFKKFERDSRDKIHVKIQKVAPEYQFIFTTFLEFLLKRSA